MGKCGSKCGGGCAVDAFSNACSCDDDCECDGCSDEQKCKSQVKCDGCKCRKCNEFYEYAEPDGDDGMIMCAGCKQLKEWIG